jgi:hypothetical protein
VSIRNDAKGAVGPFATLSGCFFRALRRSTVRKPVVEPSEVLIEILETYANRPAPPTWRADGATGG